MGGLSNSPSVAAQSPTPLTAGSYDDTDSNWIYTGTWKAYTGAGPVDNTSHYTNVIGSEAQKAGFGSIPIVVTEVNGEPVTSPSDYCEAVSGLAPGTPTEVGVYQLEEGGQSSFARVEIPLER